MPDANTPSDTERLTGLAGFLTVYLRYTGWRMFVVVATGMLGGLVESLGITLFIPLLSLTQVSSGATDIFSQVAAAPPPAPDAFSRMVAGGLALVGLKLNVFTVLGLMAVTFTLKGALVMVQEYVIARITARLYIRFRTPMVEAVSHVSYHRFMSQDVGTINNMVTVEVPRAIAGFYSFCAVITAAVYLVIYLAAAFALNWRITLAVIAFGALLLFVMRYFSAYSRRLSYAITAANAWLQQGLIQMLFGFKYLKATGTFDQLRTKITGTISQLADYQFKTSMARAWLVSLTEPLTALLVIGLISYQLGVRGGSLAGVLVLVLFYFRIMTRVSAFQVGWQKFNVNLGAIARYDQLYRDFAAHREQPSAGRPAVFERALQLEDVHFAYGQSEVIRGLSLTVPRGRTTAIVGESGAGKTTLVDLLTGLLSPTAGRLTLDGVDLQEVDLAAWRAKIGYTTQDAFLFNDTVAHNISLWRCPTEEPECRRRIEAAARMALCHEFVAERPEGYETVVGDRGDRLSGGQRQRLAIARELFKGPELLILDEATSNLDAASEVIIQRSIDSLIQGGQTMVIISHRLSAVRRADVIHVLRDGSLVESGTFAGLYSRPDSLFRKMCQLQNVVP